MVSTSGSWTTSMVGSTFGGTTFFLVDFFLVDFFLVDFFRFIITPYIYLVFFLDFSFLKENWLNPWDCAFISSGIGWMKGSSGLTSSLERNISIFWNVEKGSESL